MDSQLFSDLLESATEMGEISRGERAPAREMFIKGTDVKRIRRATKLSQERFAKVFDVPVGTIRNWEQDRRVPTGPAKVLLRVIEMHPEVVLEAIN